MMAKPNSPCQCGQHTPTKKLHLKMQESQAIFMQRNGRISRQGKSQQSLRHISLTALILHLHFPRRCKPSHKTRPKEMTWLLGMSGKMPSSVTSSSAISLAAKIRWQYPPKKVECPNIKVDSFFWWLRYIWKECWVLGKNCSVDEQTCKMQGKSEFFSRCGKYKWLDDGLQCDCIVDYGFTYDIYFCNELVPMKWIQEGMCPMHCCLLHMFENFDDVGHHCKIDNPFMSINLARESYSIPNCFLSIESSRSWIIVCQNESGKKRKLTRLWSKCKEQRRLQCYKVILNHAIWLLHHAMTRNLFTCFPIALMRSLG